MANCRKKGFTLIEVIVALSVFIIGIVSLYPLISQGLQFLGDTSKRVVVSNLAREKMSEIETIGFDGYLNPIARTAFAAPYDAYEYTVNYTPVVYDSADPTRVVLYEVELIIYVSSRSGEKQERFLTYLSRMHPS